jgi:preprotein translocase SecE subunit
MASATNNDEKAMVTDLAASSPEEPDRGPGPSRQERVPASSGFFTIYKKGQGYWTRIGTAVAAITLIAFTGHFIYYRLPQYIPAMERHRSITLGVIAALVAGASLLFWRLMNKPSNVDFLIATDSEMKKVNWTSRQELIGSTKVVILFMFLIAALLFVLDLYFTRVFYLLGVLVTDAPLWQWVGGAFGPAAKSALDVIASVVVIGGTVWAVLSASKKK